MTRAVGITSSGDSGHQGTESPLREILVEIPSSGDSGHISTILFVLYVAPSLSENTPAPRNNVNVLLTLQFAIKRVQCTSKYHPLIEMLATQEVT